MTAELARSEAPGGPPDAAGFPAPERSAVHRLLDSIEDLVRRHRALAGDGADDLLHAELIAAELDQQVAVLRRLPRQTRPRGASPPRRG